MSEISTKVTTSLFYYHKQTIIDYSKAQTFVDFCGYSRVVP